MVAFELAVQDPHGLAVAARVGADRIELCSALPLGGMTPSLAFIEAAVATPGIPPVHVLVRPRPGGFDYSPDELALLLRDVRHAVGAGASGVVVGGVRDDRIDTGLVGRVTDICGEVTFHRAIDTLSDPRSAIKTLISYGVKRVLTSAGAARVADALPTLASLVRAADDRLEVMAGGGVRPESVAAIVGTGVAAIHASAKHVVAENVGVSLGTAAPAGESGRETTDEAGALAIRAALARATGRTAPATPAGTGRRASPAG